MNNLIFQYGTRGNEYGNDYDYNGADIGNDEVARGKDKDVIVNCNCDQDRGNDKDVIVTKMKRMTMRK